ncbi:ArsR/SmtB family transcription factor [Halobellus limi]|uniref:ArsR family transcriptional regulator n=1 Tax=Halobellus limi TaxID=699433 RepID=A0A1H6B7Y3_9EURY|nr:winged helix-turn-helix domain-containing protein [Halobellus limi]QCC49188.1 ArsR family transcriptional regulator [Halobellus limi]SEG56918.1 transcriptional regulator, ArsR family [Halobellus limi]
MSSPIARLGDRTRSPDAEPAVVDVAADDAGELVDALSSETARELFSALHDDPAPPSELARDLDTSVQNVHYHLSKLRTAGVVESVGTRLSEKGNEMTVYGPAADPIVLVGSSSSTQRDTLRRSLSDWATGVTVLALSSLAVQVTAERFLGGSAASLFEPASLGVADGNSLLRGVLLLSEPGLLFFLGGLLVFVAVGLSGKPDH